MINSKKNDKTILFIFLAIAIILISGLDNPSKSIDQLQYVASDPGRALYNLRKIMGRMATGYNWQIKMYNENEKLLDTSNPASIIKICNDSIITSANIQNIGSHQKVIDSSVVIDLESSNKNCLHKLKEYEHNLKDIDIVQKRINKLKNFEMSREN